MKLIIIKIFRKLYFLYYQYIGRYFSDSQVHLVSENLTPRQYENITSRVDYYLPGKILIHHSKLPLEIALTGKPLLFFGQIDTVPVYFKQIFCEKYDIDYRRNHMDGWTWIDIANLFSLERVKIEEAHRRFQRVIDSLQTFELQKAYIFGTGPSLELAINWDWADGYRIVCNTIVRDAVLWKHINPHFIVAGDAVYHFGHTNFAKAFRSDLIKRLKETNTYFLYPAIFDIIARRELKEIDDRLIPISQGSNSSICNSLYHNFKLNTLGNILPLMLLPLACTLSNKVYLWGFDGRAPTDTLFWSNSTKHSYPELMPGLQKSHPAFFNYYVPKDNPSRYVQQVHGDVLEEQMSLAEKKGWTFIMMHKSWTPTLQKRYRIIDD
jgi:hypothetical protein